MILRELDKVTRLYAQAITLDTFVPGLIRKSVFWISSGVLVASGIIVGVDYWYRDIVPDVGVLLIYSGMAIVGIVWLLALMAQSYFNSFYYRVVGKNIENPELHCTYELAGILFGSLPEEYTFAFLRSSIGRTVLARSSIGPDVIEEFISHYDKSMPFQLETELEHDGVITIYDFVKALVTADIQFMQFLLKNGTQEQELLSAVDWVMRDIQRVKRKRRWWSREQLGLIKGLAKDWAYGRAYTLEKFAYTPTEVPSAQDVKHALQTKEVGHLEEVLAKSNEANALLVGSYQEGLDEVVRKLSVKIRSGRVLPELEHKQIFFLDGAGLISSARDKSHFEELFITILNETLHAGNIILAITHFPQFIAGAHEMSSDVLELLDPYIQGNVLQCIGTAEMSAYRRVLEQDRRVRDRFEMVAVTGVDREGLVRDLELEANQLEKHHSVIFSIQAILTIAEGAERYFVSKSVVDAGRDLLNDSVPWAAQRNVTIITSDHIYAIIEEKTGIKAGSVGDEERVLLLNLEKKLHERIVGQDEAVDAIAHALRRARSGIGNPNRPMGSFLFLGPTGVGKTEVAKTLAETFFKSAQKLVRFDMSEYSGSDSLDRLIGNFDSGVSGVLATSIRDNPYGILLLDEFEKAHGTVHNLFLQILDEGYFSDMRGERVNARNMIIIATSNEQADKIWQISEKGERLSEHYDDIINSAVAHGTFKPELLNRFDAIVLFQPIGLTQKEGIAEKLLREVQQRMKKKGITLVINDALLEAVRNAPIDPKFGARAMSRFAQDKVEQVVADKIIRGEISTGSVVELTPQDMQ